MGKPSKAVTDFMEKYGVESDEIWLAPGGKSWVVMHKALERIAAEKGIVWDLPQFSEKDSGNGTVAMLVAGRLGDRMEWAMGEASPKNNRNAYPYAMAEKRGKDRVILKLLASHGALYSEAEADEFAQPRQNPHTTRPSDILPATEYDANGEVVDNIPAPAPEAVKKLRVADQRPIFEQLQKEIHATDSVRALQAWAAEHKDRLGSLKPDWQEFLRGVYAEHLAGLRQLELGDDMRMAG